MLLCHPHDNILVIDLKSKKPLLFTVLLDKTALSTLKRKNILYVKKIYIVYILSNTYISDLIFDLHYSSP